MISANIETFSKESSSKKQDLRVLIHYFTIKNESNMLSFKVEEFEKNEEMFIYNDYEKI